MSSQRGKAAPGRRPRRQEQVVDQIDEVVNAGPFRPTWESLADYRVPAWYQDAKFGIFLHWGIYAVPGFGNEWYPRNMYRRGSREYEHHREVYGPQDQFGYKEFIPRFRAEKWDPAAWAELFRASGARFVVPVAEHHDGFAMYDTALSEWNAARMGPCRDVISELAAAVRAAGMTFGVSSHRAEHWWFYDGGREFPSDVQDSRWDGLYGPARPEPKKSLGSESPPWPDAAFLDDWLARCCELVDRFRPQIVWFDWWIENEVFAPYLQRFAAYYYNRGAEWGQGVAINYKNDAFPDGTAVFDVERGQLAGIRPLFWQTDTAVAKTSWGYVRGQEYKTAGTLVGDLIDIVSKNGALLLNLGPRPDGTIPEPEKQLLREIGRWLAVNGEAIYDSRPWRIFGEGPTEVTQGSFTDTKRSAFTAGDFRFTTRGDTLYAIGLAWPADGMARIRSLAADSVFHPGSIAKVELLGGGPMRWERNAGGLTVHLPEQRPCDHAYVLKFTPPETGE